MIKLLNSFLFASQEEEVEKMQIQREEKTNSTVVDPNLDVLMIVLNLMVQLCPWKLRNNQNVYKIMNSNYKEVISSLMLQKHEIELKN